jgi:hypothetical protein
MKYLLFVYPNHTYWEADIMNHEIGVELTKISKGKKPVNFIYSETDSVFNFNSDLSEDELLIYLDTLDPIIDEFTYILVRGAKSITSNLPKQHFKQLTNPKNKGKTDGDINYFATSDGELDQNYYETLVNNAMDYFFSKNLGQNVCTMTLDDLLDKISLDGIDSLTTEEKNKLDEYSKTQL